MLLRGERELRAAACGQMLRTNISIAAMDSATSRRSFLRDAAIAGTVACVVPAVRGLSDGTDEDTHQPCIRLGVCSYSFHQFDRAHVIDFMRQLNTHYINVKDVNDHLPMTPVSATDEALAAYKAAEIELTAAGVIYFLSNDPADIRQKFEYAKRAGVLLIVGSPTRETLPEVEKFVREYDIRLAIHNHGPEDKQWPSPLDILKVIERMDKRIGLCIDVGHTVRAGTDVVGAIHKGGARVFDIHMKDLADLSKKESQVAVGDGKMPVRGIFEALNTIGYKGYVDLEYEIQESDPLPGMMKSFAFMRGVLKEQGLRD
jgi:sugar phosphate isomerase/epimerase